MTHSFIKTPYFEIGPKCYLYGETAQKLALRADALAEELDIGIIFTPQALDIASIASQTRHIKIFAQHMDSLHPGRGMGCILPEALKAAGAHGTFLNHAEKKLSLPEIVAAIGRARDVGLRSLVCVDNVAQALCVAEFRPDILLLESEQQIGRADVSADATSICLAREQLSHIEPATSIMFSSGIHTEADVAAVIRAGADGTGCTSAIMCAEDPIAKMEAMLRTLRKTWDEVHSK